MTITLPAELEAPLAQAAKQLGATPELLVVECVRKAYAPLQAPESGANGKTLADFLEGFIGVVEGTSEPLSENTGARFRELLANRERDVEP